MKTFSTVSMVLEDTGVRAYKGQATNLMVNKPVLQAALQIHSVEVCYAARVRQFNGLKGWIVSDMNSIPNYAKEGIYGTPLDILDKSKQPVENVTECFDKSLTKTDVLTLVTPFLA